MCYIYVNGGRTDRKDPPPWKKLQIRGGILMRSRFENSRRPADFRPSLVWLAIFILFTVLVAVVNRQPVGPQDSVVGFADFNLSVHEAVGVHKVFHILSTILGFAAILYAALQTFSAVRQCVQRGGPDRVAADSLAMLVVYTVTVLIYILIEFVVIFGYLVGLLGKFEILHRTGVLPWATWFYIADIVMVAIDVVLYFRNTALDRKRDAVA